MLLVFDVGGTFIKWALVEEEKILISGKEPTPNDSFEKFLEVISFIVQSLDDKSIKGLAFSLPGTIDSTSGVIKQGGSLRYNDNRSFKAELEEKFNLPVSLENDARCALLAERKWGNLKEIRNGVVLVVGTGLGGAILLNGELIKGAHNYSGELSLMLHGDLKINGLNALLGKNIGMKEFLEKAKILLELADLTGEKFMELVKQGNILANQLFEEYLDCFAQAMFSLQMILDPERFVIGGGISEDEYFVNSIQEKYNSLFELFPIEIAHADVISTKFGNQSNILGATINHYHMRT